MKRMQVAFAVLGFAMVVAGCRTMELANKTINIEKGDDKSKVIAIMGTPQNRQFLRDYEILQYCVTGAGFGYHDYSVIWLRGAAVIGITTYKDRTPGTSCRGQFKTLRVEDAPDFIVDVRQR